jgi:hypothetical protein
MQEVALYPNPSNGYISLTKSAAEVRVFTLTGQLIKTFSAVVEGEQYSVSDLSKGLYLVKITDDNGRSKLIKFVKN